MSGGRTVWVYRIPVDSLSALLGRDFHIPIGARFLHAAEQGSSISMWFEVDPAADREERTFHLFGTGTGPIGDELTWVATVPMLGGTLVMHVYEEQQ